MKVFDHDHEGTGVADNRGGTAGPMGNACADLNMKRPKNPDRRFRPLMAALQFVVWLAIGLIAFGLICFLPVVAIGG